MLLCLWTIYYSVCFFPICFLFPFSADRSLHPFNHFSYLFIQLCLPPSQYQVRSRQQFWKSFKNPRLENLNRHCNLWPIGRQLKAFGLKQNLWRGCCRTRWVSTISSRYLLKAGPSAKLIIVRAVLFLNFHVPFSYRYEQYCTLMDEISESLRELSVFRFFVWGSQAMKTICKYNTASLWKKTSEKDQTEEEDKCRNEQEIVQDPWLIRRLDLRWKHCPSLYSPPRREWPPPSGFLVRIEQIKDSGILLRDCSMPVVTSLPAKFHLYGLDYSRCMISGPFTLVWALRIWLQF